MKHISKITISDDGEYREYLFDLHFDDGTMLSLKNDFCEDEYVLDLISEYEGCSVRQEGNNIVIILWIASGQGGIVLLWDYLTDRVIHLSNGDYTCYATVYKDHIITLKLISNYMHKAEFGCSVYPLETMDYWEEHPIKKLSLDPVEVKDPFEDCRIEIKDDLISFIAGTGIQTLRVDELI